MTARKAWPHATHAREGETNLVLVDHLDVPHAGAFERLELVLELLLEGRYVPLERVLVGVELVVHVEQLVEQALGLVARRHELLHNNIQTCAFGA